MTASEIIHQRLINQQIAATKFKAPQEIVSWMGAMQAQEFAMAKWAIGLRLPGIKEAGVEKAFNEGAILRTHLLRPTWHFVTPGDIRWILALTVQRIRAASAYMYERLELNKAVFNRCNKVLEKTLRDGKQLTRTELSNALKQAKIVANGLRLGYIMMHAELDAIICSGAHRGKQFTYTLLDERAPVAKSLHREEALAEIARRFFTSRGPATIYDLVYWSWLTVKDAKAGIEAIKNEFESVNFNGQEYVFKPAVLKNNFSKTQTSFLMPDYDEYGMSYKNRDAFLNPRNITGGQRGGNTVFNHMLIIDGVFGGTWQRNIQNKKLAVETTCVSSLSKLKQQKVMNAVKRYKMFVE